MLISRVLEITITLLIALGFFSKTHHIENIFENSRQEQAFASESLVRASMDYNFLAINGLEMHTCNGGCFYYSSDTSYVGFIHKIISSFILAYEFNYLNPERKLIKKPPIC